MARRRLLRRRSREKWGAGITKFGVTRSKWAWYIDSKLKAKVVFEEPNAKWSSHPERYDVRGVDYPLQHKFDKKAEEWLREHIIETGKGEAESFAKALGTKPTGKGEVADYYWQKYKSRYPGYKEVRPKYVYAWDKDRGMLKVVNDRTGEVLYYISREAIPEKLRHLRGDKLAKAYTEYELKREKEFGGDFSDLKLIRGKRGWGISEILSPKQQFLRDVREGRIVENGLKLSERQVMNMPPASGYLQLVMGGKMPEKREYYRRGLVVKITGDYDPDLKDDHNTWAVITEVIDPWHYRVIQEGSNKEMIIRDTDVKAWIGDLEHDYIGLGKERHRREVVPLIKKALSGKVPVAKPAEYMKLNPVRTAWADGLTLKEAIKRARAKIKELEKNRDRYEDEDYEWLRKEYEDDLRVLEQAAKVNLGTAKFLAKDRSGRIRWIPVRVIQIEEGSGPWSDMWFGVDSKGRIRAARGLLAIREFKEGPDYRTYKKVKPPHLVKTEEIGR